MSNVNLHKLLNLTSNEAKVFNALCYSFDNQNIKSKSEIKSKTELKPTTKTKSYLLFFNVKKKAVNMIYIYKK